MTGRVPRPAALAGVAGAGAVAMVVASWRIGCIPVQWHQGGVGWLWLFYAGFAVSSGAWLLLGRGVLAGAATLRQVRRYAAASVGPFALAAPFGRDLWAYAAQGNLVRHGYDAYAVGPSVLPGPFTAQVSARWLHTTTPYGPLWLQLSRAAAWVCDGRPLVAALLLRLPAFAGVGLWLWALPVLAQRFGGRATTAVWLGVAGPLTAVLGIGGGHNDVLMIGLMLSGLAVATRPGLAALATGAAVAGVAVMVKSPAAIVVAFTVPVWLHANREPIAARRVVTACAVAVAAAGAAVAVITLACGLGTGWVTQVNADVSWVSWLSLPTGLAMLAKAVRGHLHGARTLDATMRHFRTVGQALTGVVVAALWFAALRRAPLVFLAWALAAAALLAPSVQPWYYCWGLAVGSLMITRRRDAVLLAALCLVFPVMIPPNGHGHEKSFIAVPMLLGALLVAWLGLGSAEGRFGLPLLRRAQVRSAH